MSEPTAHIFLRHSVAAEPSVRPIPSDDRVFAWFVERSFASLGSATPAALETRLRRVFPRALVRPCELAFAQEVTWYVYREGRWVPPCPDPWWDEPSLPHLRIDSHGFIAEAEGAGPDRERIRALKGRHIGDFLVDGTLEELAALSTAFREQGELTATMQAQDETGALAAAEVHAVVCGDGWIDVTFRPVANEQAAGTPGAGLDGPAVRPLVELLSEPATDTLFARYAAAVLARLAAPTPGALEAGLRLLYPDATVEGGGRVWRCRRDDHDEPPTGWWEAPGLPTLVVDRESLIHAASPMLESLAGRRLVGSFWQELTPAGRVPDAIAGTEVLFALGGVETTVLVRAADGRIVSVPAHVVIEGDLAVATLAVPAAPVSGG